MENSVFLFTNFAIYYTSDTDSYPPQLQKCTSIPHDTQKDAGKERCVFKAVFKSNSLHLHDG